MATVLVLGAASDMATAIAEKFASAGFHIQLAARNIQRLEPLQSDLAIKYSIRVSIHEFDALQFNSHASFFESLETKPDVTICVFGYLGDNEAAMADWSEAEKIVHTNYTGAVSVLNAASQHYATAKEGVIVGIASVAGERGRQSNFIYGSAKAGFVAYLSGLRNRMYRERVHVVTVQPGFVYTKMTEDLQLPALLTATPEQVANSVYKAVQKKKNVVYVKWFWRWIMLIIKLIPEPIFKRMKL